MTAADFAKLQELQRRVEALERAVLPAKSPAPVPTRQTLSLPSKDKKTN